MKKQHLLAAWGGLFLLCAGLGFIPNPQGLGRGLMIVLSLLFFLPGAGLLLLGLWGDPDSARLVRNLSAASLGLTTVLLALNTASVLWPEWAGDLLHGILGVVSAPMFCCQIWALSLFLWACLLLGSIGILRLKR